MEFARNTFDSMLRNATLEKLYESNGKALGMDFTIDEDVLRNESGMCISAGRKVSEICGGGQNHTQDYEWEFII